jgi:hypothetical protein
MRSSVSTRAMKAHRDVKTFKIAPLFHAHSDVGVRLTHFLD